MLIEQYDDKTIRCPRIGGEVNFKFCRSENNMSPCRWIAGCWQRRFDINEFLTEHFSREEIDQISVPPKPKLESLVEMMEQAKKRIKEE
ncbi:MAG TPA: hypothetical protein DDW42_00545 [Desulfobacteraceae bacterium]|nr:hypothetical protein [Desulfobacteraceae bacterium]